VLSDTDIVVMTVSMENDEVDLNGLTSNDRFTQEQMVSEAIDEVVRCWGTDPQARWDMIRSTFHPTLQQWKAILEPVELCDEFTVVLAKTRWAENCCVPMYLPETAVESARQIKSFEDFGTVVRGRYICVLTRKNMFLVIPEVNVRSGPAFLFSIYGQLRAPIISFKSVNRSSIFYALGFFAQHRHHVTLISTKSHPDTIYEEWRSASEGRTLSLTPDQTLYNWGFFIRPVIPEAFKTNQLGFRGCSRTTLPDYQKKTCNSL
jgi:hypothetical protein